jgi:predicted dehydrogenase
MAIGHTTTDLVALVAPDGARYVVPADVGQIVASARALALVLADHLGQALNCGEVDAVVNLLRAHSHISAAEMWLDAHCRGDEDGDSPVHLARLARRTEADVAATS